MASTDRSAAGRTRLLRLQNVAGGQIQAQAPRIVSVEREDGALTVIGSGVSGARQVELRVWSDRHPVVSVTGGPSGALRVGELLNGESYSVQLMYTLVTGRVLATSVLTDQRPWKLPDPPDIQVEEGDGMLTVTYGLGNDGGSPLIRPVRIAVATAYGASAPFSDAGTAPIVLRDLTNGQEYWITIRVETARGAAERAIVAVPRRLVINSVVPGDGTLTIDYTYQGMQGAPVIVSVLDVNGTLINSRYRPDSPVVLDGLNNGTSYKVRLSVEGLMGTLTVERGEVVPSAAGGGGPQFNQP